MSDFLNNLDYYLDINGISKHVNVPVELNESNLGFGITAENVNDKIVKSLMTGAYKNSFEKPSIYAAGSLAKRFGNDYYADFGLFGGLVTGYGNTPSISKGENVYNWDYNEISPMAGLMMNLGKKDFGRIGIKYIPTKEGVVMMNLGIPFK